MSGSENCPPDLACPVSPQLVSAGTLTNTGTITTETGPHGGTRTLNVQLDNQAGGTLQVNFALTINRADADHSNAGTINVSAGNLTIAQSGATPSFVNHGAIAVSSGRTFTITGGAYTDNNPSGVVVTGTFNHP